MEILVESLKYIAIVVVSLLPIMNPLATIPLFMSLTRGMSQPHKHVQAKKACLYAFFILATFLVLGNVIIALFGISLPGIRIAGGIIVMILALRMIFSGEDSASNVDAAPSQIKRADIDYSFSPLAMPGLSGPGSIAIVMGLGAAIPESNEIGGYAIVLAGIGITSAISYIALYSSGFIEKLLGTHGIQAVTKIMGFLLTCVAVQFLASGVRDFYIEFSQV